MDIQTRFEKFHAENPQVYVNLVRLARRMTARGYSKIGINMLWEVLRWEHFMTTTDSTRFKLNDHYPSRYARLMMQHERDLESVFEVRGIRTK